jgi:hypothetical protein
LFHEPEANNSFSQSACAGLFVLVWFRTVSKVVKVRVIELVEMPMLLIISIRFDRLSDQKLVLIQPPIVLSPFQGFSVFHLLAQVSPLVPYPFF